MKIKFVAALLFLACIFCLAALSRSDNPRPAPVESKVSDVTTGPGPLAGRSVTDAPTRSFRGADCSGDCGGHEAGYRWAEEHETDDKEDCESAGDTSNSPSFAEGCTAYVDGNRTDDVDNAEDQEPEQ